MQINLLQPGWLMLTAYSKNWGEQAMQRVLIPVDGSERALQAVRAVIGQDGQQRKIEVHLLNVQPRIFPEEALMLMPAERIDSYYYEQSSKALEPAERLLRDAGMPFTAHRAMGHIAETICAKARELDCDAIVMAARGHGRIAGLLLGSIATQVLHLADKPVTLLTDKTAVDFSGRLQAT
jgi:nucleotide-binding universal stress UspA family protein